MSGRDHGMLPERQLAQVMRQRPLLLRSPLLLVRIAVAVTVSWLLAEWLSGSTMVIFAPITTLLVLQASPWSTLGIAVQRVLGTGLGVLVASVWVNFVSPSWWSFLVAVLASLFIASALPWSVGGQLQIPLAVIFVMALGPGTMSSDVWRVLDVVLGGLVGLAFAYLLPQRPDPRAFASALTAYRDAQLALIDRIASGIGQGQAIAEGDSHAFVGDSRALRKPADAARDALGSLAEASYLNPLGGKVRARLEENAVLLRRLMGMGIQVRGLAGAADRLYDRAEVTPALSAAHCTEVLQLLRADFEASVGAPGGAVECRDPDQAAHCDHVLADRLRELADEVAAAGAGGVLASLSLLGRIDHIRGQLAVLASGDDDPGDDASVEDGEREA